MTTSEQEDAMAAGHDPPRAHRTKFRDWAAKKSAALSRQHRIADGMDAQAREAER